VKDRATARWVALIVVALPCVLAAGCAGMKHAQPQESVAPATQVAPPVVAPQVVAAPPATPAPAVLAPPTPVESVSPAAPVAAVKPPAAPAKPPAAVATLPAAKPPAVVAALPTTAPPAPTAAAAPVAIKPAAPPLDLKSLEARLRDTSAIGVFTKLSLKNQVDDLLQKFRAYHKRQSATPLAELRQSYNMLLLKVLSLLQDGDPSLARDVVASREALWGILSDPRKFTESNLMAGVTQ
jgi:hypothetical protein